MRSVFAAVVCVSLGACAVSVETGSADEAVGNIRTAIAEPAVDESVNESSQAQSSPFGQCENLCYELYLAECALCQMRLPPRERPACYAAASERLGACLKRCKDLGS